jgi:hypothetical protein
MFKQEEKSNPDQRSPATNPSQISNREWLRLETRATPTKQTSNLNSNREKEALFQTTRKSISNRETKLLETPVTPTKQTREAPSNREKKRLFT